METGIKKEPYTLSSIIAEVLDYDHHTITRLIRKYCKDFGELDSFETGDTVQILGQDLNPTTVTIGQYNSGIYGFEIHKFEGIGRPEKHYILSEMQATLLITYLKNTPKVRAFKIELVKQFYKMRGELHSLKGKYKDTKPTQNALHRAIASHPKYKDSPKLSYLIANQNTHIARLASFGRVENKGDLTALELYEYERLEHLAIYNLASGLSLKESNKALRKAQRKIT